MSIESTEITQIRDILNERVGRMEKTFFDEMEKISAKVDKLADNQYSISDRVSRVEMELSSCSKSKVTQGERIGDLEEKVAANEIAHKERERFASLMQWLIPGVAALCGLVYWFAGVVK
jgi:predicted  nucleic acid-binding Zn-ribbon protein